MVTKCDLCKKTIKSETITVGTRGIFLSKEFCEKCAKPVVNFLKKNKFLKENNIG